MVLCFPRLTDIIIQVNGMLNRLVAMRVLSHIQGSHLSYFVDNETIGSIIISVRSHKHRVETGYHRFMSAHQFR